MTKKGRANGSFFGNHIYENLLARLSHLLYELSQVVDFSFVRHACRDFYVDWGREAWDPVLMFKMVFLQYFYDLSDQEVEEQITMAFKWFLGLSAEDFPPIIPPCADFVSAWGLRVFGTCSTRWWNKPGPRDLFLIGCTSWMPRTWPLR
jgi:Transposase domain (DUF772)